MARPYDSNTNTALALGGTVWRDFLTIYGKDDVGDPLDFRFWNGDGNVSVSTLVAADGSTGSKSYVGGVLKSVEPIPQVIGLEARSISVELDQIHDDVQDMIRAYNIRHALAEVHRGLFNISTGAVVSTLYPRFLGKVDGAPINTPAAGGSGSVTIRLTSNTIELTRTNPAKASHEEQLRRSSDEYRQYAGIVEEVDVPWGFEPEA